VLKLNIVDGGARYGLHPTWGKCKKAANFDLFEIDVDEADRLRKKYKNSANIKIHEKGLYSENTQLELSLSQHKALTSFYAFDQNLAEQFKHFTDEGTQTNKRSIDVVKLDNFFEDKPVHFLKLDTEGSELEVLKGSTAKLKESVLGVRAEVLFVPLYKGGATFCDIQKFLFENGFELINLDYTGQGAAQSKYTDVDRYGVLISTDGVWVKRKDILFGEKDQAKRDQDIIFYALFLMLNGATDVAINILQTAVKELSTDFSLYHDDPVFKVLDKEIQVLFKKISYIPSHDINELDSVYKTIFGRNLKMYHEFYESDLFD